MLDPYRIGCFDREAELLNSLRGEPDIIQMIAEKDEFTEPLTTQAGISFPLRLRYYALELASCDVGDIIAGGGWTAVENLLAVSIQVPGRPAEHRSASVERVEGVGQGWMGKQENIG